MGIVSGLVTKLNQPAGDIVREMGEEAYRLLKGAGGFVDAGASKL